MWHGEGANVNNKQEFQTQLEAQRTEQVKDLKKGERERERERERDVYKYIKNSSNNNKTRGCHGCPELHCTVRTSPSQT